MNGRQARRKATTQVASAARLLASNVDALAELTDADKARMRHAYENIAHELETRIGLIPRAPRTAPVDPDQALLFTIDREAP